MAQQPHSPRNIAQRRRAPTLTNGHAGVDEIQTVTPTNATGGTFRLAYLGQTTAPLAYNASASTVDTVLEALKTIGSGAVSVSLASGVYTVTFGGGSLHNTNVNSLQGDVSSATYGTVDRTITTTYDAASQITQESDPSATIDYTLDNLGRATSIVNTIAGLTPTVTFDQVFSTSSDRTQLAAKIASTNDFKTDFTFDTVGRMTDIVQQSNSGNAVASKHVTLAYNKLAQFTAINRYESTGTSNQVASTDFAYDTLNRLTDIDHKQSSTVLAAYDYTFDYAGRITGVNSSQDGQTDYSYDVTNQVTAADHTGQTDESYEFDANGNRCTMCGMDMGGYTVGANNLITSDGSNSYLYDDEGNRTKKTETSSGNYTTYTWDYRNRLTAVRDYNSSNALLKETINDYDTHNRLIKSSFDADGSGAGAATTRYWAFDAGINPLLEFKSSSASDVSHRYLWGQAVDQLFADEQPTSTGSAGNVLWSLADNLGTIRDIADLSGSTTSITNHRRFGAYGDLVSESNSAVDLVFGFTGKLYDENFKLQNNLFRWYDAAIGQWMSEDPLGFAAGDENLHRYVSNKSTTHNDAFGLKEFEIIIHFFFETQVMSPAVKAEVERILSTAMAKHGNQKDNLKISYVQLKTKKEYDDGRAGIVYDSRTPVKLNVYLWENPRPLKGFGQGARYDGYVVSALRMKEELQRTGNQNFVAEALAATIVHEGLFHGLRAWHFSSNGFIDSVNTKVRGDLSDDAAKAMLATYGVGK